MGASGGAPLHQGDHGHFGGGVKLGNGRIREGNRPGEFETAKDKEPGGDDGEPAEGAKEVGARGPQAVSQAPGKEAKQQGPAIVAAITLLRPKATDEPEPEVMTRTTRNSACPAWERAREVKKTTWSNRSAAPERATSSCSPPAFWRVHNPRRERPLDSLSGVHERGTMRGRPDV